MSRNNKYIKAKIKTKEKIQEIYPNAKFWDDPPENRMWFPLLAIEVMLPYLGKTVWLRKKRHDLFSIYYEIKDSNGIYVEPDWIEFFESETLVPPAEWQDNYDESISNDLWLDPYRTRLFILDDIIIITGC